MAKKIRPNRAMLHADETEELFPFDEDDSIPSCIEYYSAVEGFTVEAITHPNHLWQIADRIQSEIISNEAMLTNKQKDFLLSIVDAWMNEAEQFATDFECA